MKHLSALALSLVVSLMAPLATPSLQAQTTAFTYQGFLTENGGPVTGPAEIQFTLWDAASAGNQIAATTPTVTVVGVTNGLFTVSLDFGAGAFNGAARFLQMEVRTGLTPFTPVSPRQPVTAAPYAVRALTVASNGLSGGSYSSAVNFNNAGNTFTGAFTGDGSGLSNVNVATLGGLAASNLWRLGGNTGANPATGAFLGTADNLPLELRVNGGRALRVEPNTNGAPNLLGGSPLNSIGTGVVGASIGGGGAVSYAGNASSNTVLADFGSVGGGRNNRINTNAPDSVIGGGSGNVIGADSFFATIAGGSGNNLGRNSSGAFMGGGGSQISSNSSYATIGGGQSHFIATNSSHSFIGGGFNNAIFGGSQYGAVAGGRENDIGVNADFSFIGGGASNLIGLNSIYSVIPGGVMNEVGDNAGFSFAAGRRAKANHSGSFIWADSTDADYATTGANQVRFRTGGGMFVEGGTDVEPGSGGTLILGPVSAGNIAFDSNELMARNNGAVSPLYLNADGGNVGINRASASTSLHVGGTIRADDNLQAGGVITYLSPQTRYLSIAGNAFSTIPDRLTGAGPLRIGTWTTDLGTTPIFISGANLHLPHGALVTGFTVHLVDDSAAAGWTINLARINLVDGSIQSLASVAPTGTPGAVSTTTTAITAPLVINDTYAYYIAISGRSGPVDGTMQFRGAVIEYTVTSPLP